MALPALIWINEVALLFFQNTLQRHVSSFSLFKSERFLLSHLPLKNSGANTDWLLCRCRKKGQKDQQDGSLQQPLMLALQLSRRRRKGQANQKEGGARDGRASCAPGSWQEVAGGKLIKAYYHHFPSAGQ